jgi:Skp family chaperone for outer membrane proteins
MLFRTLVFLVATACVASAQTQETPRFAFLAYEWVIQNTVQGKRIFAELEVASGRFQEDGRKKVEELQGMEQQLNSSSLSEEGRNKIARDFEDARVAFNRWREEEENRLRGIQSAASQQFQTEIAPIIEALAKEKNLHYVFTYQDGLLAWADTALLMQFTEEVAKRYDAAFPGTGATATTPAARPASSTPNRSTSSTQNR